MIADTIHRMRAAALGLAALVLAAFGLVGLATIAQAQSQKLLTDQHVAGFIDSYPEIAALADELQGQDSASSGEDLTASLGALMTYQDAIGRLNATVAAHGFADYNEWIQTVTAVAMAYTYASEGGAMDAQMAAGIASIESNSSLTAEQKAMMLQQLQAATAAMDASRPPQQNIDLVNAHADELETIFDQM